MTPRERMARWLENPVNAERNRVRCREKARRHRAECIARGVCVDCKNPASAVRCEACAELYRLASRERARNHRARCKAIGVCVQCGSPATQTRCDECKAAEKLRNDLR